MTLHAAPAHVNITSRSTHTPKSKHLILADDKSTGGKDVEAIGMSLINNDLYFFITYMYCRHFNTHTDDVFHVCTLVSYRKWTT